MMELYGVPEKRDPGPWKDPGPYEDPTLRGPRTL